MAAGIEQTIEQAIDEVKMHLQQTTRLILQATPGLGKTTRLPLALLNETWLCGQKIVMLEPRRVAARLAAQYMASQLGESVGETVGYRIRREQKVSPKTRLELVTDGVFTRMIQEDPSLEGVALVIFDEFHERSVQSELGLALTIQSQSLFRPDLRIMLMSATFDGERLARWMGAAPLVIAEGRRHPLAIEYVAKQDAAETLTEHVVRAVAQAVRSDEGDILVFLPGVGEIQRVETALLRQSWLQAAAHIWCIVPLHGRLPIELQSETLKRAQLGSRRIILSTSVAETSVTVEGVRTVVDAGWSRVNRFSARTGLARLETVRVSKASAEQRAGRAGRLGPGRCFRLWHPDEERTMVAEQRPELLDGDLLSPTLELLIWGVKHPSELQWLDAWPEQNWTQVLVTLQLLGALDERAMVTEHGRAIARAGTDIRIASMLLRAVCVGWSVLACELAAWLTEGMRDGEHLGIDVERYWHIESSHAVRREKERLLSWLERIKLDVTPLSHSFERSEKLAILLAWAFPDRVAMKRSATLDQADDGSYRMSNGRGCRIETNHEQFRHFLIVVVDADDSGADARVRLAAPLSEQAFLIACASHITKQSRVFWDTEQERIRTVEYDMFLQLQWKHRSVAYVDEHQIISIWQDIFRQKGLGLLHWDKKSVQLLGRMRALRSLQLTFAENEMLLPLLDDEALTSGVDDWLGAALGTCRNISDVRKLNVYEHLRQRLDYRQSRLLDEWMPTHWKVPSGSNIAIDYGQHDAPVLAVRLQELFGLQQTPAIAGGRLKLSLHLLSPAGRPVQITSDLVSFWTNTYPEVRKELRGRYPKHVWPDNPLEAAATARAKPKQR